MMNIHIASGVGTGPTKLAAFDAALNVAGVANYNLLRLSSVVPPASRLVAHRGRIPTDIMPGRWGDRLYVVMADVRTDVIGSEVWAGIGWVQNDASGEGLFVEHKGVSKAEVAQAITSSLGAMTKIRGGDFGVIHMKLAGTSCIDLPVCALVVAVYQASDWQNNALASGV